MSGSVEALAERLLGALSLRMALAGLTVVTALIAWNRGVALLYGMVALLVAALVVGHLAPRFNLRGITVRRRHPERLTEGDVAEIELIVSAPGRRYMLELSDRLPFADEERVEAVGFVPRLAGEARVTLRVPCALRGLHPLGPVTACSAYPLGLTRVFRRLPTEAGELLVYPRPFPLRELPLLGASQSPIAGVRAAQVAGGGDELFGVREYRRGDSPRHIHWPSSARRRQLVVREYELIHSTDLFIVLDLRAAACFGEGRHSTLEYAVKIAASAARWAIDAGHGVGLAGYGAVQLELPVGRGPHHYQGILEALARVKADGAMAYREAVHRALARFPQGGALLLFDAPPLDHGHPEEGWELQRHHVRPLWVRFDVESFEYPLRPRRRGSGGGGREGLWWVRREDDLAEVFAR